MGSLATGKLANRYGIYQDSVAGFAAGKIEADPVVYGKIFTSENNRIAEAFAVKDGKFVYVGNKAGAKAFIKRGKTEVIDYSGKGLVMPITCRVMLFRPSAPWWRWTTRRKSS